MSPGNAQSAAEAIQILIVEDNGPDVFLLKMALNREYPHCVFHVVETGEDAFRFLRRQSPYEDAVFPDLVILDMNVPFKSGEEVLHLIRNTDQLKRMPVVLCSSSPWEKTFPPGQGPDACIAKPAHLDSYMAIGKDIMDCYWRNKSLE